MKQNHDYISDKLILDAINGINVVARDHNISKSRQNIGSRVWDSITGSSRKRQDMTENLIEGINVCTWLQIMIDI